MKLTAKQEAFINEYMIDLNATQAAIRAGYNEKTAKVIGCENLTKPYIRDEINRRITERAKNNGITADMVLNDLLDLKDKCLGRKPIKQSVVLEDGTRVDVEKFIFDSSGANKSLENLGKHLKLFTDKIETENTNHNIEIKLEGDLKEWAK